MIVKLNQVPVFIESGDMNVTSPFGFRVDPVTGKGNGEHKGIDLTRWTGYSNLATICAFADGVVTEAVDKIDGFDNVNQRGNYVTIDHGSGFVSKYYHLARGSVAVRVGESITARTKIGYMGSTGYSTGAHLHFQLEKDGEPIDPHPYLVGEKSIAPKKDNTPSEWAEDAVEWAVANGIIYGDENGNLMLRENCTREQMLVFLYRALVK